MRVLTLTCNGMRATTGPWPGLYYTLPMFGALAIATPTCVWALRRIAHGPGEEQQRRDRAWAVTGAWGLLVSSQQLYAVLMVSLALTETGCAGALGVLAIGLALAWPAVLNDGPAHLATAYVVVLVLGISLFVAAHYYKIVPFLVWYHRFGPLAGKRQVPTVSELYSARHATAAGTLLVLGTLTLAAAVALGVPLGARIGALLLVTGTMIEAGQSSDCCSTPSNRRPRRSSMPSAAK